MICTQACDALRRGEWIDVKETLEIRYNSIKSAIVLIRYYYLYISKITYSRLNYHVLLLDNYLTYYCTTIKQDLIARQLNRVFY